jgi:ribosome recycling factor
MSAAVIEKAEKRMKATLEAMRHELAGIRTGRASLTILDGVMVEYYGTATPLNQVAKLAIPEPTLITVTPFDPSLLKEIEGSIRKKDMGLNPSNDGKMIRVPVPPLTEERRKQLAKKAHQVAEEGRTAARLVRRDANEEVKQLEKDKELSEDDSRRLLDEIQKLTDRTIATLGETVAKKEKEILEI